MGKAKQLDHLGISAFAESMAMMLQSGVPIDEALLLMRPNDSQGLLSKGLSQMAKEVSEGTSFHDAMQHTGIFPEYALEMVQAGERTGSLENVMRHLSDYYQNEKETADKLRSAVIYPLSMIGLIIAVLIIMLTMVLPVFSRVYENLAASSLHYIRFAYVLCRVLLFVMVLLVVIAGTGLILWKSGKRGPVEKVLRLFPSCASILDDMGKFRFTSAFGIYLSSGEMQDNALLDSMKLTDCAPVEEKLKNCAKIMEEGHSFSYAANREELYEPIYGRMLVPAERSGNMEGILNRLTSLLKADISTNVTGLVNTVEPLLSGILMISIGLVLVSLMLPLIGMMSSIG